MNTMGQYVLQKENESLRANVASLMKRLAEAEKEIEGASRIIWAAADCCDGLRISDSSMVKAGDLNCEIHSHHDPTTRETVINAGYRAEATEMPPKH